MGELDIYSRPKRPAKVLQLPNQPAGKGLLYVAFGFNLTTQIFKIYIAVLEIKTKVFQIIPK